MVSCERGAPVVCYEMPEQGCRLFWNALPARVDDLPGWNQPPLKVGGFVFKAHRLLYHSALGSRVTKKKKKKTLMVHRVVPEQSPWTDRRARSAAGARVWPHGGLRTFYQKSTCPDAVDFQATCSRVTHRNYLRGADGEVVERKTLRGRTGPHGGL